MLPLAGLLLRGFSNTSVISSSHYPELLLSCFSVFSPAMSFPLQITFILLHSVI